MPKPLPAVMQVFQVCPLLFGRFSLLPRTQAIALHVSRRLWSRMRRRRSLHFRRRTAPSDSSLLLVACAEVLVRKRLASPCRRLVLRRRVPSVVRWRGRSLPIVLHSVRLSAIVGTLIVGVLVLVVVLRVVTAGDEPAVVAEGWETSLQTSLSVDVGEGEEADDEQEEDDYDGVADCETGLWSVSLVSRTRSEYCARTSLHHQLS